METGAERVPRYIVAGTKPWNRTIFDEQLTNLPGTWCYVSSPDGLDEALRSGSPPRYVFFLHWSHRVPAAVVNAFECVCFHMTDVPYGRGGSPLQNLIERGHTSTTLTALRMGAGFDDGPVYTKVPLALNGTAEEVYVRATELSVEVIRRLVADEPEPVPQEGTPIVFRRRTPEQSRIDDVASLDALGDFIRMLDAEGYPHAFLEHAGFRFEFTRAARYNGRLVADVTVTRSAEPRP